LKQKSLFPIEELRELLQGRIEAEVVAVFLSGEAERRKFRPEITNATSSPQFEQGSPHKDRAS
jgi:hypothetical protein